MTEAPGLEAPPPASGGRLKRVLGGAGWQTLAQVAPLFVNIALTPFVITHLGRELYGLWIVTSTLASFFAQFDGGIGRTALRYFTLLAGSRDRPGTASYLVTLLLLVTGIMCVTLVPLFFLSQPIAQLFHTPPALYDDVRFLLQVMVVTVGVSLARNLFASILQAYQRFAFNSVTMLLGYVVYAAGMWYTVGHGMGLRGIAYVYIAQQAVATLLIVPATLKYLQFRGLKLLSGSQVKDFTTFGLKVQASGLLTMLSFQGVTLIVGALAPRQVPDFTPGATFAQQLRTLPMNVLVPAQSMLGTSLVESPDRAPSDFQRTQRLWTIFTCGWVAVGAPAAYFGVTAWLPLGSDLAGQVAAILLVGHLFAMLPMVLLSWVMLLGHPEIEVWGNVVTVALTIALAFLLVGPLGVLGVALGTLAAQIAGMLTIAWLTRRVLGPGTPTPLADVPWLPTLVAAGLTWLAVSGVYHLIQAGTLPHGALGLVLCGLPAGLMLALYSVYTLGWRRVTSMVAGKLRRG